MSGSAKKVSTNFNTSQLKVAFFDLEFVPNVRPMDGTTMSKLLAAAKCSLLRAKQRGENIKAFSVLSPTIIFGEEEAGALEAHFKDQGAKILSSDDLTFVVQSKQGHIITFKVVGGARFAPPSEQDSDSTTSSNESDYQEMNGQGLTQECRI